MIEYRQAIEFFGERNQILKCVEELNELAVELMHDLDRKPANVCEELADVIIMVSQMKLIYPDWKSAWEEKIQKLAMRVCK